MLLVFGEPLPATLGPFDRFEILAAAQAAFLARIPIAHLHGGEATEGALDDGIRHAITKLHTRVDVESQVEIERTATTRLGMEIHLPRLAQRVGLDDVPLVVDMETVFGGMLLEVGDESSDVDGHADQVIRLRDEPTPRTGR